MLWRREPYPGWSRPSTRDGEDHAGREPIDRCLVEGIEIVDDLARIAVGRDRRGDAPEAVTGPHDVSARRDQCGFVPHSQGPSHRPAQRPDHAQTGREGHEPAANIRSMHGTMLYEHAFEVKRRSEHMFAWGPSGC